MSFLNFPRTKSYIFDEKTPHELGGLILSSMVRLRRKKRIRAYAAANKQIAVYDDEQKQHDQR